MNDAIVHKLKDIVSDEGKCCGHAVLEETENIFSTISKVQLAYDGGEKTIFVKKYKHDGGQPAVQTGQTEFEILSNLYEKMADLKGMSVIKPITYLADEDVLVTEAFHGEKLSHVIVDQLRWLTMLRPTGNIESHFSRAGRWLQAFQRATNNAGGVTVTKQQFRAEVTTLFKRLERFNIKEPFEHIVVKAVDGLLERVEMNTIQIVGCHHDFTPWNILVNGCELAVLDFARFSYGALYEDVTLFLSALEGFKSIIGIGS